jgi:dihydroflavonol-4-reductase
VSQSPSASFTRDVLVLGATGFIGGHIALAALEMGWHVRALRRDPDTTGSLENAPVDWVTGDLNDPNSLVNAMQGIDTVFHAAGYYPTRRERRPIEKQIDYALTQTRNVLQAATNLGVLRLIYTSTLTTIGKPPAGVVRLANENDYYTPGSMAKSAYYEAKFAMEQAFIYAAKETLPCVVLNPTAVFGPGDVHLTLGGLLLAIARGWGIAWLPVTINVVDVRDVARAHIQAAIGGKIGERYIIGGHNISLRDALFQAAAVAHVPAPRFQVPLWIVDSLVRLDDSLPFVNLTGNHLRAIRHWEGYDTTKAEVELGLSPRPVEETLRAAYAWFIERGLIPKRI